MKRTASRPRGKGTVPARAPANRALVLCLAAGLLAATVSAYSSALHFGFVNYDDPAAVSQNAHIRDGLTTQGVMWALESGEFGNWFPVTRLSYLADREWFNLEPGFEHVANIVLHGLTAVWLFALLHSVTCARWRSLFAASLFALHPMRVESVAWISERKDVLSGFFWFAAMAAYVHYTRRPSMARYALVAAAFVLGLMSKPVVVTLPFVLLLLDYWPLHRATVRDNRWGALCREKLLLFGLAASTCVVTLVVQAHSGAIASWDALPLAQRLANGAVAYVTYLYEMLWPAHLAVFYPIEPIPVWQAGAAVVALAAATYAAVRCLRRRPWSGIGWLWFLGTMTPMIGIVQAGAAAHADRYTYIPSVGLAIAVAWVTGEVAERASGWRPLVVALAAATCVAFMALTWRQTSFWENSSVLFRHAVQSTTGNWVAYNNLGAALRSEGQSDEAIEQFRQALLWRPGFVDALVNLCEAYNSQGRVQEGAWYCTEALVVNPHSPEAHGDLASALEAMGLKAEAEQHFREVLRLRPDDPKAYNNLGLAQAADGHAAEAIANFEKAIRLDPGYANAELNLGAALANSGHLAEAEGHFTAVLRIRPDDAQARTALETVAARLREDGH